MMRLILLLLGGLLLMLTPAQAGHKPPQIMLRIHIQTAGQGLPSTQASTIKLPPDGETIQIRALPEVTEHDLIGAMMDPSGNTHLQFNHKGTVDLSACTGQNQGRILVVMLNGYVIYAPIIDEQITNGQLVLPHPLDPQILQLLQQVAQKNVKDANRT